MQARGNANIGGGGLPLFPFLSLWLSAPPPPPPAKLYLLLQIQIKKSNILIIFFLLWQTYLHLVLHTRQTKMIRMILMTAPQMQCLLIAHVDRLSPLLHQLGQFPPKLLRQKACNQTKIITKTVQFMEERKKENGGRGDAYNPNHDAPSEGLIN